MAQPVYGSRLVTVFGGSGFVGRQVVRVLAHEGYRVRAAVRRPDLAGHLQPLGGVGQIHPVQANLRNPDSVARATEGAEAVVNLVGLLSESGKQKFAAIHAQGARNVAEAAKAAGAQSLVQMSAIGADAESRSRYGRTKAEGEVLVREAFPSASIVRPSLIFGPGNDFFSRMASMARLSMVLPLIGGATRFQPVYVGDVAEAIATLATDRGKRGTTYELGGPQILTMRDMLELMLEVTGRKRWLAPVPMPLARLKAAFLQFLPGPPITPDQVKLLARDNVVSDAAVAEHRTLEDLSVMPTAMGAILPTYLVQFRRTGQFVTAR